jgi:MFS family permease
MQHLRSKLERNITLLMLLSIDEWVLATAITTFFQMRAVGLSLSQVLIGESLFALTILVFDVPTSIFSDLFSRKSSFIFSEICAFFAVSTFAFARSFTDILFSQFFAGCCVAVLSGTNSAMLFDTLKALGREGEHPKYFGRITAVSLVAIALGGVLSGFIGAWNLRVAVSLCMLIPLYKLTVMSFLTEPPHEPHPHARAPFAHAWTTLRWFFRDPILPILTIGSIVVSLAWKMTLQTYNPFMESVGIPIWAFGIFTAAFNLTGAAVSHYAHDIRRRLGGLGSLVLILGGITAMFTLMTLPPVLIACVLPGIIWIISPFRTVFFADEMNRRTTSDKRATTLSMASFGAQFLQVLALPFLGFVADASGLRSMYLLLAGAVLVTGLVTIIGLRKILT